MKKFFAGCCIFLFVSCNSTTYYIVRHAEKQATTVTADPPLTTEGEKQAEDLKTFLINKQIKTIYATNYVRTMSTAEPLRLAINGEIKLYDANKIDDLVKQLKLIDDGNVLIVGHSNKVDDVVNGLTVKTDMTDLNDSEYGDVFIVTKKGNGYSFQRIKLPKTTPR